MTWAVNPQFADVANPTRTVTFNLTTMFQMQAASTTAPSAQSGSSMTMACIYTAGSPVACSGSTDCTGGSCSGAGTAPYQCGTDAQCSAAANAAALYGTLCVAQIKGKYDSTGVFQGYQAKYWPKGDTTKLHCLTDYYRLQSPGGQQISKASIGKANAFTVQVAASLRWIHSPVSYSVAHKALQVCIMG